jgi:hypothetical protein
VEPFHHLHHLLLLLLPWVAFFGWCFLPSLELSFKSSYAFSLNHNLFWGGGSHSFLWACLPACKQERSFLLKLRKSLLLDLFCDPVLVCFVTPYISLLCKKKKKKKKKKLYWGLAWKSFQCVSSSPSLMNSMTWISQEHDLSCTTATSGCVWFL